MVFAICSALVAFPAAALWGHLTGIFAGMDIAPDRMLDAPSGAHYEITRAWTAFFHAWVPAPVVTGIAARLLWSSRIGVPETAPKSAIRAVAVLSFGAALYVPAIAMLALASAALGDRGEAVDVAWGLAPVWLAAEAVTVVLGAPVFAAAGLWLFRLEAASQAEASA